MLVLVLIFALSVVGCLIHLYFDRRPIRAGRLVELILLYQIVFNVGVASLLAFFGLIFLPDIVAEHIGWEKSPFQHELANANLGYAVLGILAIWIRGHFWTAIILGVSVWLLGDAIGHLYHGYVLHNHSPGNTGILVYSDIFIPVILLTLLVPFLKHYKG